MLGGGLSGHRSAHAAAKSSSKVSIVHQAFGASTYIIGFNVPIGHADPRDNSEIYYEDILQGGYFLNEKRLVEVVANNSINSFYELVDTCIELFAFINNNMQFIVDNNAFDNRLANIIVDKGNHIINEIHRKDKTRAQAKKFERCRYYTGNVIDLIEHYILKKF